MESKAKITKIGFHLSLWEMGIGDTFLNELNSYLKFEMMVKYRVEKHKREK
jgi:hypothetical protein